MLRYIKMLAIAVIVYPQKRPAVPLSVKLKRRLLPSDTVLVKFHWTDTVPLLTYAKRISHVAMRTAEKPTTDRNQKLR
jgi:hypothetical protein